MHCSRLRSEPTVTPKRGLLVGPDPTRRFGPYRAKPSCSRSHWVTPRSGSKQATTCVPKSTVRVFECAAPNKKQFSRNRSVLPPAAAPSKYYGKHSYFPRRKLRLLERTAVSTALAGALSLGRTAAGGTPDEERCNSVLIGDTVKCPGPAHRVCD